MYELKKKIGKVLSNKSFGTGPSLHEKRIYRSTVSQRLWNTALEIPGFLSTKRSNIIQRLLIPLLTAMTTTNLIASSRLNLLFCLLIQRRASPVFLSRLIVACKWELEYARLVSCVSPVRPGDNTWIWRGLCNQNQLGCYSFDYLISRVIALICNPRGGGLANWIPLMELHVFWD